MASIAEFAESLQAIDPAGIDVVSVEPKGTPLYTLLTMPGREQTAEGAYDTMGVREGVWENGNKWFGKEVDEAVKTFTVNGAIASTSTTTVVVDSTAGIIAGAVLRIKETEEQIKVASVTNATTFEAVRGFGTTAAANIPDDATLAFVATSVAAGTASVDTVAVEATEVDNQIQKIVTTVRSTDYEDFLKKYPGVKDANAGFLNWSLREHAKRIERAMLLGQKKADAAGKYGTLEGVLELAKRSGNVTDISGGFTKATLVAALRKPFNYGNRDKRYALCGADALDKLALLFEDRMQVETVTNTDLSFSKVVLPGGEEIYFKRHPDMTSANGLNAKIVMLDVDQINVVYGKGEDLQGKEIKGSTRVIENTAESTYANKVIDIVTYVTLASFNARAHGLVKVA